MGNFQDTFETCERSFISAVCMTVPLKGPLHLAKFAIANIVQVLAQMICKVERSKTHIAQVKKF